MDFQAAAKSVYTATLLAAAGLFAASNANASAADDPLLLMGMLDQFEMRDPGGDNALSWSAQGWMGRDLRKLWFKTEGERAGGETDEAELQLLYSRAIAPYWDLQFGVRHDFEPSPSQSWAVIGMHGLAPFFFETDVAFFIGESGRTALRLESAYELLLTQRLILTPEIEVNFHGQNVAEIGIGSGLSDLEVGLRLRYEVRREFAPYIGINWSRLFGNTKNFARDAGENKSETQLVIGLRAWF